MPYREPACGLAPFSCPRPPNPGGVLPVPQAKRAHKSWPAGDRLLFYFREHPALGALFPPPAKRAHKSQPAGGPAPFLFPETSNPGGVLPVPPVKRARKSRPAGGPALVFSPRSGALAGVGAGLLPQVPGLQPPEQPGQHHHRGDGQNHLGGELGVGQAVQGEQGV